MSEYVSFTWVIKDPVRLPSVLTGLALRTEQFTVKNVSSINPAWHIEVGGTSKEVIHKLMEQVGMDAAEDLFPS